MLISGLPLMATLIGGTCGQPFVLSQQFLHSIPKSLFTCNTGKRAANFSAWIRVRQNDLMEGGINLTTDLQCGDIFHLFSLVFSGELSFSPCLPDEGVGEAEDLRSFKRRAEDNELCDADKAKKLKSVAEGQFVSRREKGFLGIMVSVCRTEFPTTTALELFTDKETFNSKLLNEESSPNLNHMREMLVFSNNVTVALKSSESPWEAMASYTEHMLSNPSDEGQGGHFDAEIIKAVCTEIQKAGDQGLSIEDIYNLVKMPGEKTPEIIIDTLQAFGRPIKVNAYDSVRVVDALYHSNITVGHAHKGTILNLPEEHALPSNEIPTSTNANESCMYDKVGLSKWDDGDVTINKSVYNGLVRRVLGTVMQNPGILEQSCMLNNGSCSSQTE
ncbi:hypothetical protein F3Y22_tig00112215pilonHSYRG00296 [Hibiscus syriacus]|uniref:Uncharacterized protein n=1 Tax=Hibiscus syriacus TaxID=106335 RepID=A0A6A2Y2Y7_HIBSY|nr:hypothetical protein F3Y22_tig00112215pilonHSYRG00296 [Hibiscus syriacus]